MREMVIKLAGLMACSAGIGAAVMYLAQRRNMARLYNRLYWMIEEAEAKSEKAEAICDRAARVLMERGMQGGWSDYS